MLVFPLLASYSKCFCQVAPEMLEAGTAFKILHNLWVLPLYSRAKGNWIQYLCKIFGDKQGVLWGMHNRRFMSQARQTQENISRAYSHDVKSAILVKRCNSKLAKISLETVNGVIHWPARKKPEKRACSGLNHFNNLEINDAQRSARFRIVISQASKYVSFPTLISKIHWNNYKILHP